MLIHDAFDASLPAPPRHPRDRRGSPDPAETIDRRSPLLFRQPTSGTNLCSAKSACSARVSRPRRNDRPKVSSSISLRLRQPTSGAAHPPPPKQLAEGHRFSPAKSMPPGDSQVRA